MTRVGGDEAGNGSVSLHSLLLTSEHCGGAGDAAAVRDRDGRWTYRQLIASSRAVADWLRRRGVVPGDRFAVWAAPDRRLVAMLYGSSLAGATFVPLNPALSPVQLAHVIADAAPALIVTDNAVDGDAARRAAAVGATVLHVDVMWAQVTAVDRADGVPPAAGGDGPEEPHPALLIYTSGSTSMPKAVVCPHAAVVFAARAIAERLRYRPDDVVFCRLPFAFDYGLYQILLAAIATAELVIAGPGADALVLAEIRRCGATVVPVVPFLALMLARLATRDRAPTAVRLFTNTGEALPATTIAALRQGFPHAGIVLMFGTTECKRITILEVDGDRTRPGSVGQPLPGTIVQIVGETGEPLPAGQIGEIVVRGRHLMGGYWRAAELTRTVYRQDLATGERRLHTGDYGYLDADGYLYFVGRRDHIFKVRGLRTSVLEIEAAAVDIPDVREAAVVPPWAGHEAVLYLATNAPLPEVLRQLRQRLEPGKIPGVQRVLAALPRGSTGKVDRAALAAAAAKDGARGPGPEIA